MSETGSKPVLVVDDSLAVLTIVRSVLQQLGFERIDEARDGSEALKRLRERHYGLVISDWNMEPMTGYALLRHIRSDERLRATPFIMMTIDTDPERMVAAKRAGVDTCLIKPFSVAALREKITSIE
ncbi:response regulator [Methylobacterium sp. P31]